jgi:hypothetical protein
MPQPGEIRYSGPAGTPARRAKQRSAQLAGQAPVTRVIAVKFLVLAAYVIVALVIDLAARSHPERSPAGIGLPVGSSRVTSLPGWLPTVAPPAKARLMPPELLGLDAIRLGDSGTRRGERSTRRGANSSLDTEWPGDKSPGRNLTSGTADSHRDRQGARKRRAKMNVHYRR